MDYKSWIRILFYYLLLYYPMVKSLIIIGYGPGLSAALATRFGAEGYTLGLISRTRHDSSLAQLAEAGITAHFEAADAGDIPALQQALHRLSAKLGGVGAVVYNAAGLKAADLALRGVRAEYGFGLRSTVDILIADQSYRGAQLDVARARADVLVAQAGMLRAIGGLNLAAYR